MSISICLQHLLGIYVRQGLRIKTRKQHRMPFVFLQILWSHDPSSWYSDKIIVFHGFEGVAGVVVLAVVAIVVVKVVVVSIRRRSSYLIISGICCCCESSSSCSYYGSQCSVVAPPLSQLWGLLLCRRHRHCSDDILVERFVP